jgi:hypothetical protein
MDREADGARDPVLENLLRHIRPPLVKATVTKINPERYTATHEVIMLVSMCSINLCWTCFCLSLMS